jgi:predicted nucleic acid-binding protein
MIVDTSVIVEFLRGSGSRAHRWLAGEVSAGSALVVPEIVAMEILIGTTDESIAAQWRRLLHRFEVEPLAALRDSEDAAAIHRRCRREGDTVRSLIDCQIAAMALRLGVPVAHRDRDFEVIAEHCRLQTVPLLD